MAGKTSTKAELEARITELERDVNELETEIEVLIKENERLTAEPIPVSVTSTIESLVILNHEEQRIIMVKTAKELFEDIKKRNVGEGHICIVIDREGPLV